MSSATQAQPNGHQPSEKEKTLQAENESLKAELKELEATLIALQNEMDKSVRMRSRLEGLAKELENRMKETKDENRARMLAAEKQSQDLANGVTANMGAISDLSSTLNSIAEDSQKAKTLNDDLGKQVADLKKKYDDREQILQAELDEAHNALIEAQTNLAKLKLHTAEEKERLFGEMQKVANGLVQSKQEMKGAKETELGLRVLLQKYDEKFKGLQGALTETNTAYDTFKQEMDKMGGRTKALEVEANKWKAKWEESNVALLEMTRNQETSHHEMKHAHDKLLTMTNLCRALQKEISEIREKHAVKG